MRPRDRLLVVLGVCLPVPVFAATGLSVPLPATVERLATELVPFSARVTPSAGGVAAGSIVLTDAERRAARAVPVGSRARLVAAPPDELPPRGLAQRRQGMPPARRSGSDETHSAPVVHPAAPDPAPVALPLPTRPTEDDEAAEPVRKDERTPRREGKPKPEPKQKPKHEREPKPKPQPQPPRHEPKPEEEPKPAKPPKRDSVNPPAADVPGPEKDNRPDGGNPSEPEVRPSR
jgi:hypothetical protein